MKGRILTISVLFLSLLIGIVCCDTKNSVEPVFKQYFIKYYGEDGDQEANDFTINSDGSIIIIGTTTFGINKRLYLLKVDPEGNEIWKKQLGSLSNEFAKDIEPILNGPDAGNFVVLSNVAKNDLGDFDIRLTVINTNGDSLKSTLFNFLQSQEGRSITPLVDGGYFLSGKTTDTDKTPGGANAGLPNPSADVEDLLIVRFQSDFSYFSYDVDRIGGSYIGSAAKVFQEGSKFFYAGDSDGLTRPSNPDNTYESNFYFRIFVTIPNSPESSVFSETSPVLHETLKSISKSPSGPFMAIGTQIDLAGTSKQLFATIITSNFAAIQAEGLLIDGGSQREAVAVAPSSDFSFLVLANEFNAVGIRDIYLRKTNVQLGKEFEVRFGAPNNDDTGSAVAELPNGDILILGTMSLTNQKKIALIKLNSNGKFE